MKKMIFVMAMTVAMGGCVSAPTKPMVASLDLQGKTIVLSQYATPDFSAMTPGKAVFGMFGAAAMISAGNELVRSNHIEDPALQIGHHIADDLVTRHAFTIIPNNNAIAINDKPATLVKTYPGADLILDVKTINWMYSYYPTNWGKYHVFYTTRARLLDGKTGNLIAQQMCKGDPTDPKNPPSADELRADHAALLKQLLRKVGDDCSGIIEPTFKV